MPIDPGTLQGYDQLLSISEEAVNRQLKALYLTEADPLPPNGSRYLINHEMHFHSKRQNAKGDMITSRDGLDAWVCCPRVEFGGKSIKDEQDKYRTAVIRFKFRRAEEDELTDQQIASGKGDSVLVYKQFSHQDDDGNDIFKHLEIVINNWEISWETTLDKKDIQNILEDIIKPAESDSHRISLNKELTESLKEVSSANFQVSTIFCAMQDAQLVRSFNLVDETGNPPTTFRNAKGEIIKDGVVSELIQDLKLRLVSAFTTNSSATGVGSTPENPFVLGYTVSQKRPSLEMVNGAAFASKLPTPKYFVPKSFRCNLSPHSTYCEGTLNYCMLTHRAKEPPNFDKEGSGRTIKDGIDGAGRFEENVFARLKTKAEPGAAEGALFFCQDIFVNHWIGSFVAPLFYLSPDVVAPLVAKTLEDTYSQLNRRGRMNFGGEYRAPSRTLSRSNVYSMTNNFSSGRKIIAENSLDDPTESMKLEYNTTLEIKYDNVDQIRDSDEDVKRRLRFTIGSYTFLKVKIFRRLAFQGHTKQFFEDIASDISQAVGGDRIGKDVNADDQWEEAIDANIYLNYKHFFDIGTSPNNSGSFTVENSHSEHMDPNSKEEKVMGHQGAPPNGRDPGLWVHTVTHNWAAAFEGFFDTEKGNMDTIGEGTAKGGATLFKGAVDELVNSLGTTVILPAGDVFMFKGFSKDEENNVFTTISYRTPVEGSVQERVSKAISQGPWQRPQPVPRKSS